MIFLQVTGIIEKGAQKAIDATDIFGAFAFGLIVLTVVLIAMGVMIYLLWKSGNAMTDKLFKLLQELTEGHIKNTVKLDALEADHTETKGNVRDLTGKYNDLDKNVSVLKGHIEGKTNFKAQ